MGVLVAGMDVMMIRDVDFHPNLDDPFQDQKQGADARILPFQQDYAAFGLWAKSGSGLSYADVTANAEITWPGAVHVRSKVQLYFDSAHVRNTGAKGRHFMNFSIETDPERQCCLNIPHYDTNPDPSVEVYVNMARSLGFNPGDKNADWVNTYPYHEGMEKKDFSCQNGVYRPPNGDGKFDFADEMIRRKDLWVRYCIDTEYVNYAKVMDYRLSLELWLLLLLFRW